MRLSSTLSRHKLKTSRDPGKVVPVKDYAVKKKKFFHIKMKPFPVQQV